MSGIIREFLVSLGFLINEQQMRRFQDAISGSTSAVSVLGRSALETALQVTDAVEKMAKQYEGLHYASQRTHATVGNLKAIAYASSQVGMSAEEGAAAVEGFANALRIPGKAEWLKSLGVTSKDAAEGVGQLMKSLKKTYGDGSIEKQNIAESIAGGAGINPGAFLQIWNNSDEFFKYYDAYIEKLKNTGTNTKSVADESKELMQAIRELGVDLDLAKVKFLKGLIEPTKEAVKWFDELIQRFEKVGGYLDKIIAATHGDTALLKEGVEYALPQVGKDYLKKLNEEAPKSGGFYDKWRRARSATSAPQLLGGDGSIRIPSPGQSQVGSVSAHARAVVSMIESGGRANARTGRYKGKNMLSDEEFGKYGGGNIYNAEDNDRAATAALEAHAAAFRRRRGRNPTLTELYLMHQQGVGGAEAHMAHPERPAWMNMYSTAEGRKKGPGWARKAVWGNVPDDMKGRYGGASSITSQEFTDMWREKVNRFSARLGVPQGGDMQMAPSAPEAAGGTSNAINQTNHFVVNAGGLDPNNAKSAVESAMRAATGYMYVELNRHN